MFYILHKVSDSETEITNIAQINPKGKIPKMMFSKLADEQFEGFKKLRAELEQ